MSTPPNEKTKKRNPWSHEEVDALNKMRQKGWTHQRIAEHLGRTYYSVHRYIGNNKHRISEPPRRHKNHQREWTKKDDFWLLEMAEMSTPIKTMMRSLGRSTRAIRFRLRHLTNSGSIIHASSDFRTVNATAAYLDVPPSTVMGWVKHLGLPVIVHQSQQKTFRVVNDSDLWIWLARTEHQHLLRLSSRMDVDLVNHLRESWSKEQWYTMHQAADYAGLTVDVLWSWRNNGGITCYYPYRNYCVVRRDELERAMKEQRHGQR